MPFEDEWGHDPSVQRLRRVFSFMEEAQQELLNHLNISLFDKRLRSVREQALGLFEKAWPLAIRRGIIQDEKEIAVLYLNCLARAMGSAGIEVPKEWLPANEEILYLMREKLT